MGDFFTALPPIVECSGRSDNISSSIFRTVVNLELWVIFATSSPDRLVEMTPASLLVVVPTTVKEHDISSAYCEII